MKLTVLADNRTQNPTLETEHGLCAYLDAGEFKVLLDTGASDVFLRNASALGIDVADVDYVFISHGHRDHAGGLQYFLENNEKARVIVSSAALRGSFHSSRKGMHDITPLWPWRLMEGRVVVVDEDMEVAGMKVISSIGRQHPIPKADKCLYMCGDDGGYVQDDFVHEIALQVGGFLFSGCAHNGLLNILESAEEPVHAVLGGFHLLDSSAGEDFESDEEIREVASDLLVRFPGTVFYTGHCTGDTVFASMKRILGDGLRQFCCGMSLEV